MKLATIRVKLSESDPEPKQKLDEGEHIVKRIVEVSELYNVLQGTFFFVSVLCFRLVKG
jgi:ADP-ribose pyrophosphatase